MSEQITEPTFASATQNQTLGARQMEPRFGFDVYKLSVKLFEKHTLQIFLLGLVYLLFLVMSNLGPLVWKLALSFVAPVAAIGVLRCLKLLDSTLEKVKIHQLRDIFFDPTRKNDYLILGAINVGYTAITIVLSFSSGMIASWIAFAVGIIYLAAVYFAYPLIEFDRVKPFDALKVSLQISKLNWKVAVVYFITSVAFLVLSLCALGVGFFIFFPLTLITRYVAYKIILNR